MVMMPMFGVSYLPPEEQEASRALNGALHQLGQTVDEFRSTVELFRETIPLARTAKSFEARAVVSRWPFIAARNGALCIYDFFKGTQEINGPLLKRCPTIAGLIRDDERRAAGKLFSKHFPNWNEIRNAAAHPAEVNSTPEKMNENYVNADALSEFIGGGGDGRVLVFGSLNNEKYTFTIKGKVIGYSVSRDTVVILDEILQHWANAFTTVEAYAKEKYMAGATPQPLSGGLADGPTEAPTACQSSRPACG